MADQATTITADNSNSIKNNTQEIDVREALDILAARSHHDHDHDHHHPASCHHVPTKDAVHWGQRIPLGGEQEAADNDDKNIQDGDSSLKAEAIEQQRERIETERAERRIAVEQQLNSMSVLELLQVVMSAQEERVMTYRKYDE